MLLNELRSEESGDENSDVSHASLRRVRDQEVGQIEGTGNNRISHQNVLDYFAVREGSTTD
jgi:hypothetical protein